MTDYKKLCGDLLNRLNGLYEELIDAGYGWIPPEAQELMNRAWEAMAQPEPEVPTEEELLKLTQDWPCTTGERHDLSGCPEVPLFSVFEDELIDFARAVLARWGK